MTQPYYNYVPQNNLTPPRQPIPRTTRDGVFALLFWIGSVIAIDFGLFGGFALGHTVAAIALCIVYFLYPKQAKTSLYGALCLILAVVSSMVFAVRPDSGIHFWLYCLFFVLLAAAIQAVYGVGKYPAGSFRVVWDWVCILFAYPFVHIAQAMTSLFSRRAVTPDGSSPKKGRLGAVVLGLLCALPVLLIVVPLLIHADAAFASFVHILSLKNFVRWAFAVLFGSILFIFLFSHAFGIAHRDVLVRPQTAGQSSFKGLPTAALLSFSGAISFFYLLYLISQIRYFFSAFFGKLPEDFLPAEYARRGFFEMCVICVINLVLVCAVLLLSGKKENGKFRTPIALECGFIILFSLVLIATAISKMALYIDRFGMTHLRIGTSVFMIILAFIFLALLVRLAVRRFPYMKSAVLTTAILVIALGFVDLDALVATYNVSAYQSGALSTLDTKQLARLGDSAVPSILELLDDKDPKIAAFAGQELALRLEAFEQEELSNGFDFRSFNYTSARAEKLLRDNRSRFEEYVEE